jgi:hypothetical protein
MAVILDPGAFTRADNVSLRYADAMASLLARGGYFFVIDEWRREFGIEGLIGVDGTFTEAVSAPDWQNKEAEIVFLSMDGKAIDYVCLGRRTRNRAASLKNRIRFTDFHHFDPPIILDDLIEDFTARLRPHLIRTSQGHGHRVPPSTWAELLDTVERMRPASVEALARLERARRRASQVWSKSRTVVEERDAVNLALRIAGMNERELLGWDPGEDDDPPEPFLAALETSEGYEAQMIEHDANVFGSWRLVKKHLRGANQFERGRRRLTVFNVNTRSVETTLGVDLIYYTARYDSYVLVQYKRMLGDELGEASEYRPSGSYQKELAAMEKFEHDFCDVDGEALRDYRLDPGPFYFKLAASGSCSVDATTMVPGMYIPLAYWRRILADPVSKGERDGVRITREAAGRWITNTLFVELVQDGWIGSRTCRSGVISRIINTWLRGGHSLILAGCFDLEDPSGASR